MRSSVHVWSDLACPWCYLGLVRLEQGATAAGVNLDVVFHSFELEPKAPPPGDTRSYVRRLADKYRIPESQAQAMIDQMAQRGREEGIAFDFSRIVAANTFDAHQLLHLARTLDSSGDASAHPVGSPADSARKGAHLQLKLKQRLLRAHFAEGRNLAAREDLLDLSSSVGIPADLAARALDTGEFSTDVRQDEAEAKRLGITGVPFFVIEGYGIGGAQPAKTFQQLFERLSAERSPSNDEDPKVTPGD